MKRFEKIRLPRLLGFLALAASLVYLGATAVRHASSFPQVIWSSRAVAALAGAVGLHLIMSLAAAAAWHLLLRSTGATASRLAVLAIWGRGQVGKYLPGNVGQYLGRAALARQQGIPLHQSALTLVFETAGLIVMAAVCALLAGWRGASAGSFLADPWKIALLAAGAVAVPFLLAHALERWFPEALRKRLGVERLPVPPVSTLGACLALYAVCFVCGGLSVELLARGLFGAGSAASWVRAIPAFALSWVAGFVTPGAPAGLGIREALLVGATAPLYGPGAALSTALALRAVTVLGDGLAFLLGWGLAARARRAP